MVKLMRGSREYRGIVSGRIELSLVLMRWSEKKPDGCVPPCGVSVCGVGVLLASVAARFSRLKVIGCSSLRGGGGELGTLKT